MIKTEHAVVIAAGLVLLCAFALVLESAADDGAVAEGGPNASGASRSRAGAKRGKPNAGGGERPNAAGETVGSEAPAAAGDESESESDAETAT